MFVSLILSKTPVHIGERSIMESWKKSLNDKMQIVGISSVKSEIEINLGSANLKTGAG